MLDKIAFEYRKDEPFRVVKDDCIGTIRTMEGGGVSKYIMEVKVIGQMDNTIDHTFESANRVYDVGGGISHNKYLWRWWIATEDFRRCTGY